MLLLCQGSEQQLAGTKVLTQVVTAQHELLFKRLLQLAVLIAAVLTVLFSGEVSQVERRFQLRTELVAVLLLFGFVAYLHITLLLSGGELQRREDILGIELLVKVVLHTNFSYTP